MCLKYQFFRSKHQKKVNCDIGNITYMEAKVCVILRHDFGVNIS